MSVNSERKPFSVPEFLGGGIALATVALIAFGGLRVTQPQNSLPAPTRYEPVSIRSSEALAKLSIEQPRELSDVAGATRDVQSPDTRLGTETRRPSSRMARRRRARPSQIAQRFLPPGGP